MKNSASFSSASRRNYLQLLFVFAAFALMAGATYHFIGKTLRSRLLEEAKWLLFSANANVRAGLSEAETTLLNSYYIVQGMVEWNASRNEILDYLTITTEWMRKHDQGLLGYYGIFGYIYGEFYNSIGFSPGNYYIPQTQPWYQTAIRNSGAIAYTVPYKDRRTGDTIFSAVRNIDLKSGEIVGILAIDININWLVEYVNSLKLTEGSYGILLNQNMTIMAYPNSAFLGRQLQDLGGAYEEIARTLRAGGKVFNKRIGGSDDSIFFFDQIFKDWYVGIVAPSSQFYRDLYDFAQILTALGLVLSLALCFILLRLSAAKMRADEESKFKSSFLASMSHEIRTPMNAITGMAELLLRGKLSDEARGYAQDIKQAGNNLISIINDILDLSKIEAGKLEITPAKYMFSSLLNDTVNIILMRLAEKPIQFFTNIDGAIPNSLIGDEVRLRQILINLLSNAVKYTEKGYINLSVTEEKRDSGQVWLRIMVSDTGKGIKPEDQPKLFGEFVQVDMKKNMGIEGTGLGLAITKRLCLAMGGNIGVESEYGSGSTFTAIIPQSIESSAPFAVVEKPEQKKVLVFESRTVYEKSIRWSLENLRIPHIITPNPDDFTEALLREEWFFVFAGYSAHERIKPMMENAALSGKKPLLAIMAERAAEANIPDVHFLFLPVQTLSIANILNGKTNNKGYTESSGTSGTIRFTFKQTRLLLVDDIPTNLKVAEGLLAPYGTTADTCLSGAEAIELVKQRDYDIVFMDHMMPEMDGIEATAAIRALDGERFKTIPIIALTANAVSGMREMFIEKGFNDFLAKPIDISKLDEMLERWIPKEKRERGTGNYHSDHDIDPRLYPEGSNYNPQSPVPDPWSLNLHSPIIPGVDVQKGISMTGGTMKNYLAVLSVLCKDTEERLPLFTAVPEANTLPAFTTQVHALKSAAAAIGAATVSEMAKNLEAAGKTGALVYIQGNLESFLKHLTELIKNIRTVLEADSVIAPDKIPPPDSSGSKAPFTVRLLHELEEALGAQKVEDIDRLLDELARRPLEAGVKEALEQVSDEVLMAEYNKALEIIREVCGGDFKK
jgi:signal transduction histidine kinase/FixJ family two-component response regulator/HPt (histidine-containing phosphotransfer) domain-containing protein